MILFLNRQSVENLKTVFFATNKIVKTRISKTTAYCFSPNNAFYVPSGTKS